VPDQDAVEIGELYRKARGAVTARRDNLEYISPSRNEDRYRVDADGCHHCRERFKPGQTRFPIFDAVEFNGGWGLVSICMRCFKDNDGYLTNDNIINPTRHNCLCHGCNEPLSNPDHRRFRWKVCSHRCYQRVWWKCRREHGSTIPWKVAARTICQVCKQEIQGRRKDARFCSNACRQWAYRRRNK